MESTPNHYIKTSSNQDLLNQGKNNFINKLYLDPIDNMSNKLIKAKSKGYRLKTDQSKSNDVPITLPNMLVPQTNIPKKSKPIVQGNVIIQNWETIKNVPEDIGELIHYPFLVDRNKFQNNRNRLACVSTDKKLLHDKDKIRKDGENLVRQIYKNKNGHNLALSVSKETKFTTENNYITCRTEQTEKILKLLRIE